MAGTKLGGIKASGTNKKKYGSDFYREIGRKGGRACVPKGFALMGAEKTRSAGQKGGKISKRGPAHKW